jgi:hypothetical protein
VHLQNDHQKMILQELAKGPVKNLPKGLHGSDMEYLVLRAAMSWKRLSLRTGPHMRSRPPAGRRSRHRRAERYELF